jgi:hypothetical protein
MTIEANVLPSNPAGIAKKFWTTPMMHVLDINAAQGADIGPLCDKHGSLSSTNGNDRCDPATK